MPICTEDCIFKGRCHADGDCTGFDSKAGMLLKFSEHIHHHWIIEKYWDGEPCERSTDPKKLVDEYIATTKA